MKLEIRSVSGSQYCVYRESALVFAKEVERSLPGIAVEARNIFGDVVMLMSSAIESIREADKNV